MERGLGRIQAADTRDQQYPLRALLQPNPQPLPAYHFWRCGPVLDQGATSMCVGFASRQWLTSSPVIDRGKLSAAEIYHGAQANDEWDGEGYDGTSGRGAMKYLQALGYVGEYHWAANAEEAAAYVLTRGGVLIGIGWWSAMFTPDKEGLIKPLGGVVGGHELFVSGYNRTRGLFRLINSWSSTWGDRGRCWLAGEDLQLLLDDGGDCVAPTQLEVTV